MWVERIKRRYFFRGKKRFSGLTRTGSTLSITPEALEIANKNGNLSEVLIPVEKVLEFLPEIRITDEFVEPIANGNALPKFSLKAYPEKFKPGIMFRVCNGSDKVLAIVESLVDQDQFRKMTPKDVAFKLKRVLI